MAVSVAVDCRTIPRELGEETAKVATLQNTFDVRVSLHTATDYSDLELRLLPSTVRSRLMRIMPALATLH